jgi:hypothetical protein
MHGNSFGCLWPQQVWLRAWLIERCSFPLTITQRLSSFLIEAVVASRLRTLALFSQPIFFKKLSFLPSKAIVLVYSDMI